MMLIYIILSRIITLLPLDQNLLHKNLKRFFMNIKFTSTNCLLKIFFMFIVSLKKIIALNRKSLFSPNFLLIISSFSPHYLLIFSSLSPYFLFIFSSFSSHYLLLFSLFSFHFLLIFPSFFPNFLIFSLFSLG